MSQYNDKFGVRAGADLRTHQFKAVGIAGTVAITNEAAMGIQQNKPNNGEDLSMVIHGRSKFRAGGALTAGQLMMVTTSGWLVAVTSGQLSCGRNFEAISSGSIGEGYFNFANCRNDVDQA